MNNLEERLQTALAAYEAGNPIRKVCKENNISKSYFRDYMARIEKNNKILQVNKEDLVIGDVPTMEAPEIKFADTPKAEEHVMDLFETQADREFKLAVGLAKYRYSKGLTQDQFAVTCGVSGSAIGLYESGRVRFDINNRQCKMVFARIGLSIDEIITLADKQMLMPKYKGYEIVRRNVTNRLNEEFGLTDEVAIPMVEKPIVDTSSDVSALKQQNEHLSRIQSGLNKKITTLQEQLDEANRLFQTTLKNLKDAEKKNKDLLAENESMKLIVDRKTSVGSSTGFDEDFYKKRIAELENKIQKQERIIDKLCAA